MAAQEKHHHQEAFPVYGHVQGIRINERSLVQGGSQQRPQNGNHPQHDHGSEGPPPAAANIRIIPVHGLLPLEHRPAAGGAALVKRGLTKRLPAVKTPPVAAENFLMPFPSGGRNHGAQPGISYPVQSAWGRIGRAALRTVQAARVHHGAALGTENAVGIFPAAAKNEEGPKPQPSQQGQDNRYSRVQKGISHQVFRPGMIRLVHEGFRTDGILRHIRKLAYIFFTHVPQRPRGKPLLYRDGFFHDWTCKVRHKNSISRRLSEKRRHSA